MKPPLVGELQRPCAVNQRVWRLVGPLDRNPQPPTGVQFLFELTHVRSLGGDEIARQPLEIGVDAFVAADRLDAIDRCDLAFMIKPRIVLADGIDQLEITIVDLGHEMRGGRAVIPPVISPRSMTVTFAPHRAAS